MTRGGPPLTEACVGFEFLVFPKNFFERNICFEFAGVARWIASGQIRIGAGNLTAIHFLFFGDRFLVGPLEKIP